MNFKETEATISLHGLGFDRNQMSQDDMWAIIRDVMG